MTLAKKIGVAVIACVALAALYWGSTTMSAPSAPTAARNAALNAVEHDYPGSRAFVYAAARNGDCVIVEVQRRDVNKTGPSVSLKKVNDQWVVGRISEDFDTHAILGVDHPKCP